MKKITYAIFNLFLGWAIFIINTFSNYFHLYWLFPWLDMVMHAAGGFFVGSVALYTYYYSGYLKSEHNSTFTVFFISVLAALMVGVLWEFFEFGLHYFFPNELTITFQTDVPDLISDLFFDLAGGIFAGFIYKTLWHRS